MLFLLLYYSNQKYYIGIHELCWFLSFYLVCIPAAVNKLNVLNESLYRL